MLITLDPGLVCKKCDARIKLAREIPGDRNYTLVEDVHLLDGDFSVIMSCPECVTVHEGEGFIRKGVFRGIHTYKQSE
jgi:hypothetical protein